MYYLEKTKKRIADAINRALGKDLVKESDLVSPPDAKMGDLSLPCFGIAKELNKSAAEITSILTNLSELSSGKFGIEAVKVAGLYLNFVLDKTLLAEELLREITKKKDKFGYNKSVKKERIMIEYSNGNTHKELHIGHLRNICYGDAVNKILAANGYTVIPVSYINDFGIHVAKTLWALNKFYKNKKDIESKGSFLAEVYIKGSLESENNDTAKKEINELMARIENGKGAEYKLWQTTRKWSIEQFKQTYKQLGVKFKDTFYESELIDEGKKLVKQLVGVGILKKSQGAVIADLEKFNLGVLVFLRSDGTALYSVADLPLAVAKFKKYKSDESIYVVDIRQGQYFKQLFKIIELMGYKQRLVHLGYEFVKLPSGMMSSRTGNVITYDVLLDEMSKRAHEETKKRHGDWQEKKIKAVASKLAIGAMKFEMIKVSRSSVITFDIEKALRFEGFTAAYLQYTSARIQSIARKAGNYKLQITNYKLTHPKEQQLVMKLAKYPESVKKAAELYEPSEIAKYLFELAQEFNDYYHEVPVLKVEPETRAARLTLINSINRVLVNGLYLLGIETIKEM